MDKRLNRTIVICDTDMEHSFTLEGELKNHDFDVVNITDATELVRSVQSLRPSVVLVNPDMTGFNEYDVCKKIKNDLGIPLILLMDSHSTHRDTLSDCEPDDVMTKPANTGNLVMLIQKQISLHQQ
jgi:DNA-binding response OmpR family regulator